MHLKTPREELTDAIISENGVVKFDFQFVDDNSGIVEVSDNSLEISFKIPWEFDPLSQVIILHVLDKPSNKVVEIVSYLSEIKHTLTKMNSAYDVIGE